MLRSRSEVVLTILALVSTGAQARELCDQNFETIADLRVQIESQVPMARDDPQWTMFDEKAKNRLWWFSKNQPSIQAAVCISFIPKDGALFSEMKIACFGSDQACGQVQSIWTDWRNGLNEKMRAATSGK
jgi:hypothetical protein